ncbi:MAG: hypothetical protein KME07_16035 [Pegethrix bostrychoides GSE-TBD4-15B]|jgi:hypothetical protein|uniref:Uncharacterized protein n=1 Tax=Pegethrix bostrychoides GSE-TBD4-15B TaxID=2839662 RepID=A0A951U5J2_9CYAN|nr:hypothetical protein [Pegethrix bostrychoides GSE-TBD4-15B]
MHPRNLFTFNSKAAKAAQRQQNSSQLTPDNLDHSLDGSSDPAQSATPLRQQLRSALATSFWFCCALASFDAAINLLFPYPKDPLETAPKALSLYFDYGRSLEGKVARQIGSTDETSALIAQAGWLGDLPNPAEPKQPKPGHHLISLYGMSFVGNLAEAIHDLDPSLDMRLHLGPASPPNHTFAAYQRDRGQQQADIVVFGILASSVRGMDAVSGMNLLTDFPAPFTFPHYELQQGKLVEIAPKVQSLADLRQAFQDPQQQQAFAAQMQQYDRFFDSFIYEQNLLDRSAMLRMIRRAWAKTHQEQVESQIHDRQGFKPNWPQVPVLKAMVAEFAATARADGKRPLVILFNDRGFDDHLYQLLQPTLEANQIPYFSTHETAPATDGSNFVGDGHFTEAANHKLAEKALSVIQQELRQADRQP